MVIPQNGKNLTLREINGTAARLPEDAQGVSLFQIFPHIKPENFRVENLDDEKELEKTIEDAQSDLLDIFYDLNTNPLSALVLNFSDSHGAYLRYDCINHMLDEVLGALSRENINIPIYVCFNGDGATKKGAKKYCDRSEHMFNFELWLSQVRDCIKDYNSQSELFINFGNHDTQDTEDWLEFMEKAKEHNLIILTPFSEAFSNSQDSQNDLSVSYPTLKNNAAIAGRTLFVPYNTNLALCGLLNTSAYPLRMNADIKLNPLWANYLVHCFTDGYRTGRPTSFFGHSFSSIENIFFEEPKTTQNFPKNQEIPLGSSVVLFGDRHLLNPVSEVTADNIFGGISYLAKTPGPINVILIAHDHYLRPEIFLELMSCYVKKYRLDSSIIERLRIWITAGHEHAVYGGNNWTYLYDIQGQKWKIPTIYGAPGIFLEACNIFPIFSTKAQENHRPVILRRQLSQKFTSFNQYLKNGTVPAFEDDFFTHPETPRLPDFALITAEQLSQENSDEQLGNVEVVSSEPDQKQYDKIAKVTINPYISNQDSLPHESPSFFNKMLHLPYFWTTVGCVAIISAIIWQRHSIH